MSGGKLIFNGTFGFEFSDFRLYRKRYGVQYLRYLYLTTYDAEYGVRDSESTPLFNCTSPAIFRLCTSVPYT